MKAYFEDCVSKSYMDSNKKIITLLWYPPACRNNELVFRIYKFLYKKKLILNKIFHPNIFERSYKSSDSVYRWENSFLYENFPKVVVYTAIFGKYDILHEPLYINPNVDYYAITDFEIPRESRWKRINPKMLSGYEIWGKTNAMANRYCKMHPHKIFSDYDISVYVDGNILVVADIMPMIFSMPKDKFLGIHSHPQRNSIYTEAKALSYFKKNFDEKKLNAQLKQYRNDGYDNSVGLLEATILIRRHNIPICIKVMEEWWKEINTYSARDQISLPYVLWKNNVDISHIHILGSNLRLNPRFRYETHS